MMTSATRVGDGLESSYKIIANIFISFIGAGVLGLPFAFKEAGIIEGTLIMTLVGVCSVKAMLLIIDCKDKLHQREMGMPEHPTELIDQQEVLIKERNSPLLNGISYDNQMMYKVPDDLSYGDVGYYAMGKFGRLLVEIAIIVSQIGFCCAYIIFISENLSDYIKGWNINRWLLVLLPPLTMLTMIRHLSSLAISSLLAQISNILAFCVVFWFDFEHFSQIEIHPKKFSLKGFPFFLAVAIYCYEGAGMILSLEGSLAPNARPHFKKYFKVTMICVTMLYISFGSCGYLSFGPNTNPIITLNLPKGLNFDFAIVVKSCLCLALFFTYPVMMFPVVNILENRLLNNPAEKYWHGNLLRSLLVMTTGVIVLAIPNFANLMALVGATCCTMLAFCLPGLFHFQIYSGSLSMWQIFVDIFLISLGIVGAVIGTLDAISRLGKLDSVITDNTSPRNMTLILINATQDAHSH